MPIEKEYFLKQFSQQSLDNRVSLFLGAGSSRDVGYPGWGELFAPLAKELNLEINKSTDYYRLAQYYSNIFGTTELRKRISDSINKNNYKSDLLNEIIDIGFNNIWTTNFDNVLEMNYQNRNILINKVFRDSDIANLDVNRRINIFKMNGDITSPESIIATQSDYEKYIDSHKLMLMFFKRELISSTFLFVGYSFTDHLVLECLSEISRYLDNSANYHYAIMRNDTKDPYFYHFINDLEKRYNLRVLLVNNYSDIPKVLSELNEKIRNKRIFISGAFSNYEKEIEEYSHKLSRSLSNELLKNDYRIVNAIGRRFGTHLLGYANEFLAKEGIKNIEKYLIIKPFVGNEYDSLIKKRQLRESVISQCGAAIFIFGEDDGNAMNMHSGVLEEFEIASSQHKTIIPIAYPGKISEKIWHRVKTNITEYPYLEGKIDMLTYSNDVNSLVQIIVQILNSVQETK